MRADASDEIGMGHVTRCIALGQRWQDEVGPVVFVVAQPAAAVSELLRREGMALAVIDETGTDSDARRTRTIADETDASWIVVDGYHFGPDYHHTVGQGLRVLVVDDDGRAGRYQVDAVLNQNLAAEPALYERRGPRTQLLLGPRFALLRRQFLAYAGHRPPVDRPVRRILVTMGGSDPGNATLSTVRATQRLVECGIQVTAVVGPANPNRGALADALSGDGVDLVVDPPDFAELMAAADLAVSAAGSTCWELAFMGVPSVLVPLFRNQQRNARRLAESGAAVGVDRVVVDDRERLAATITGLVEDDGRRAAMARAGRSLVDGQGSTRVVSTLVGTLR